jgi:hypothetical protein
MGWFSLLNIGLQVLEGILAAATNNKLPAEIITAVEAALASLRVAYGTPVTREQLEAMRG